MTKTILRRLAAVSPLALLGAGCGSDDGPAVRLSCFGVWQPPNHHNPPKHHNLGREFQEGRAVVSRR